MATQDDVSAHDDGLVAPDVGAWAEEKHRLVSLYATLFSSGMKAKWSRRIYVELYAGAGYSRIRSTSKFISGSPLLALRLKDPFDKYIFCEEKPNKLKALEARARRIAPSADIVYVQGDCNKRTSEILAEIPQGSAGNTVLSLCFADPFDIGLEFATIRALATARYVDFLVLLALGMDANRNYEHYLKEDADKVDRFLGSDSWRERWATAQWDAVKFTRFLADEFTKSMAALGYIPPPHYSMKEVRSHEKNLALYRLALFSRHERAYKFWDQVLKYSTDQTAFWD
ncbi:MAG: three-Cys-motif partner protein TcmP [Terriglobales bacterium]|jgi:three-Cys-motif partner protein